MGERRNRKSFWDTEDETKHMSETREHNSWAGKDHHSSHGSGRYHDLSDSRTTSARDLRDHPGWSPWESIEEDPIAPMNRNFKNTYEGKEMSGGKRYHKNISPGFEEMELHNYNHTHEYDRSHSQRYMGKGRSRSRSRSRTRGRSRSRSLSRGRERERERQRERGWSRSRSRSRSRSDGYGYASAHRRSRSPIGDYRRQSYWSDKRSGQEKSSQTCRDFASGRCRKGSQCRFFHPNSISRRDGDLVEDGKVESWRSRPDHSQMSKHSYTRLGFESRNDVSDLYHGEDEQFPNRSRTSIPCRDFRIGNCRWGDACRFSHDSASADSFCQDTRNTTFDKDFDRQQLKNVKPLCKFFAAGRCSRDNCRFSHDDPNLNNVEGRLDKVTESQSSRDKSTWWNAPKWDDATRTSDTPKPTGWGEANRDNCRFSHDDPNLNNLEGRLDKVTESQSSRDKSNWWNAPQWDDATRTSDTPKPTGWGEAIATNTTSIGDITNGQSDDRWGFKSKNENKIWGIQECTSNSLDSDRQPSLPRESGNYGGDTGPAKSFVEDSMPIKQEHPILHGLQLQNKDGIANLHGLSGLQENLSRTVEALQQNVPPAPHIQQQHCGVIKNNPLSSFGSNVLDEVKDTRYTNHPILQSGQSFNQNSISMFPGHSSVSNDNDILYSNLSNEHDTDLKRPERHIISSLNVQVHGQNDKKTVQSPGLLETKVPKILINLLASKHPNHVSNSPVTNAGQQVSPVANPVSLTQSFVNERSQTYAGMDVSSSRGMLCQQVSPVPNHVSLTRSFENECSQMYAGMDVSNSRGMLCQQVSPVTDPIFLTKSFVSEHSQTYTGMDVSNSRGMLSQQVSPVKDPVSLTQSFVSERAQTYADIDVSNSRGMLPSLSRITGCLPLVNTSNVQDNVHAASLDQFNSMGNSRESTDPGNLNLSQATDQNNQMQLSRSSPTSIVGTGIEISKLKHPESPRLQVEVVANLGVTGGSKATGEESKGVQENKPSENLDGQGKLEEGSANKDEKGMRLFKNSLVELVKEILKPTWKEGRMSRDVHKTVVKKVVDKVSSTIQADHVPKTQDKVDLYLSSSKPKITKLVQAYVERSRKPDA